jgi:hypothetical protein
MLPHGRLHFEERCGRKGATEEAALGLHVGSGSFDPGLTRKPGKLLRSLNPFFHTALRRDRVYDSTDPVWEALTTHGATGNVQ